MQIAPARLAPIIILSALAVPVAAQAQPEPEPEIAEPIDADPPNPDKSQYHLFNPTPRELWRPLSADRPDATESPYTVDAGAFQLEMSFLEWSTADAAGERLDSLALAPINFKIGITNSVDLQILINPYLHEELEGGDDASGIGNLGLRWKQNLYGNDEGPFAIAILPFITFPTGDDDVASDEVEGGVILPVAIELPQGWGLGLQAEIDFIDDDGDREETFSHTAVLGHDIIGDLAGYIEYIGEHDLDGDYDSFLSAGLTYGITPDIQLDAGAVLGLNGDEDLTLFSGITIRF